MKENRTTRTILFWTLAVGTMFWLGSIQAAARTGSPKHASPQAGSGEKYVGSETCQGCHEQQFKQIEKTPHFKTTFEKGRGEPWHACESCHGPGAAHVEGGGDKTKIFTFKGVSQKEISTRCMECHQTNPEHMTFNRSPHSKAGVGCTSCHNVHQPKEAQYLLNEPETTLCYSCHT